jgi:hypothetical protein
MNRRPSKGKGKRLPSPTNSSDEENMVRDRNIPSKRPRKASTERIQASALAKMANNATTSSSKGMAGFSALITNRTNLSAATLETNRGLKGGISGRRQGRTSAKSKAVAKAVWITIHFLCNIRLTLFSDYRTLRE